MRRVPLPFLLCCHSLCPTLCAAARRVHERPFLELPPEASQGEAYDMARDALLQLNVMVRRGIEPDALMYTSLIATMGRARLEWQAYKLFSRMLDQGVQPLPETYVALRDATSFTRRRLRSDLQQKIEKSLEAFPAALAEAELSRRREQDRLCVKKFEEYMRGELPPPPAPPLVVPPKAPEGTEGTVKGNETKGAIATVHIRNPTDAWSTARMVEEMRGADARRASGDTAKSLSAELERLHDEELRIFLTAQRQLRHGERAELIQRIMNTVPEKNISDMLERRHHYFRSVAFILENDLNALRATHADHSDNPSGNSKMANDQPIADNHIPDHYRITNGSGGSNANMDSGSMSSAPSAEARQDRTLTSAEKDTVSPEVLYAPWGILRKPMRRAPDQPAPRDTARMDRMALSVDELQLLRDKAMTKDLDELPENLLRRYALEFNLTWKRRHPLSLLEAVQWHVTTFFAERMEGSVAIRPTPALRRQQEGEGMQRTLENYEAFRIISQRTNNLQVVDSREINLHLKQVRREALRRERHTEDALRRERNLLGAAALAASATEFDAPAEPHTGPSRVVGITEGETEKETERKTEKTTEIEGGELPPWALFAEEEEFNIATGRFGDPALGRYQELSDGRFKVLPSREAQRKWAVDRQLLPGGLRDELRRAELQRTAREEAIEGEYRRRMQFGRYRRWDALLRKAQEKRGEEKRKKGEDVAPLPPKQRLSMVLRKGKDKAPVDKGTQARYNKSL